MKNLMNKIRKSNKGFTLVELIIVVAIIAVLTAVLAPQYIKYVERAEDGALEAAANDVLTMAKTEAALGSFTTGGTITVTKDGIDPGECVYDGTFGDSMADFVTACGEVETTKSDAEFEITVTTTDATRGGGDWSNG